MPSRAMQVLLVLSALVAGWLAMQAVHELGHVVGAWMTGGRVRQVVLHPLTISRTDLAENPQPLAVVWMGPLLGVVTPLAIWAAMRATNLPGEFLARFFAGFCLIGNGAYIAGGSWQAIGDCGVMLSAGSPIWTLWLFGALTLPPGFVLLHSSGEAFGFGAAEGQVDATAAWSCALFAALLLVVLFFLGNG